MNASDAATILEVLAGYHPTPALTEEEVKVWYVELCGRMNITAEEAVKVITAYARSGETFRMRPGQIVAEVQALRRKRATEVSSRALIEAPYVRPDSDEMEAFLAAGRAACEAGKQEQEQRRAQRLAKAKS